MVTRDFGVGICLGNSLDCWNYKPELGLCEPGPEWETAWGNPRITKETVRGLKKMGFKTVKIPVTWNEHFTKDNESGEWMMDSWFIERVKELVDFITDEGLYCIINTHHDSDWLNTESEDFIRDKFYNLWKCIAGYFKGYKTDMLSYEPFNESGNTERPEKDIDKLANLLNGLFHEAVRGVEGNTERLIIYEGFYADIFSTVALSKFPEDDNAMIAVHFYTPWQFTIQDFKEPGYHNMFNRLTVKEHLMQIPNIRRTHGMDVMISEFSCNMKGRNPDKVLDWFSIVFQYAKENNISLIIWDNGYPEESVIDRYQNTFQLPKLDKLLEYYYR